jgi:hypothetical protein
VPRCQFPVPFLPIIALVCSYFCFGEKLFYQNTSHFLFVSIHRTAKSTSSR